VDWIGVYKGQVAGLLESGHIKCGEFPGPTEGLRATQEVLCCMSLVR